MLRYEFLVLALLFAVPPVIIAIAQPALRRRLAEGAAAALPFALSERWFYPSYWSPRFLFDLVSVIGFGLEDLIFVASLGAFATTAYPALFSRRIQAWPELGRAGRLRLPALILGCLAAAAALRLLGLPMIFAAIGAELVVTLGLILVRRDLLTASLFGGIAVATVYALTCVVFAALIPGVFEHIWHTEGLIHRAVVGVPIEELCYGFASGALAAVVFPFARGERYLKR
ncbi:MAG: lycopene cyclase domain-containing protein [Myxococcota bacterium]